MKHERNGWSRRRMVKFGIAAGLTGIVPVTLSVQTVMADEMPRLDESDKSATALGYVHDASTIEAATRGGADRVCKTCRFYTKPAQTWGPCTLFPGKAVNANGWCKGWVATTG